MTIQPLIFSGATPLFFKEHGLSFIRSLAATSNKGHIFIYPDLAQDVKPKEQYETVLSLLQDEAPEVMQAVTFEFADPVLYQSLKTSLKVIDNRGLYTSYRFLHLSIFLAGAADHVLSVDMDSIFRGKVTLPEGYDFGVFLRENNKAGADNYEREGMKTLGSVLYVTDNAKEFVNEMEAQLVTNEIRWFADQHAIYKAYLKVKDTHKVLTLDQSLIDWDFSDDALIWTGKGDRKRTSKKYLDAKKEFERSGKASTPRRNTKRNSRTDT